MSQSEIQQLYFKELHFEFSAIPDIDTNQLFPITVIARLDNGAIDTGFNDCVDLYTNHSTLSVDSREICLINGIGSDDVKILGPGADYTVLEAKYLSDVFGSSNTFSVVDPLAVPTTLSVKVGFDSFFHIGSFSGTVYLENPDGLVGEQTTQTDGVYSFTGLSPGVYKLWAVRDSGEW